MSWTTLLRRWAGPSALALAMSLGGRASAQTASPSPADPQPAQVRAAQTGEVCVPAGVAVTLINQAMAVAEVMPAPNAPQVGAVAPGAADTDEVRIVVVGPARVGACADYEGFWAERSSGAAAAALTLYRADAPTASAAATPVASDRFEDRRTGPWRRQQKLRAMVALTEPGTYSFLASLTAKAAKPDTSAGTPVESSDALRLRFVVVVKPRPTPAPPGAVSGVVEDLDGTPLAGAVVMARALAGADPGRPLDTATAGKVLTDLGGEAAEPGARLGAVAVQQLDDESGLAARTGADGRYVLKVPAGRYLIVARAPGFQAQWFDGKTSGADADAVEVVSGATRIGVDFALSPAAPLPEPPVAPEAALVSGAVVWGEAPVQGARVYAIPTELLARDPALAPSTLPFPTGGPVTGTREDGSFEMKVPPGEYVFATVVATAGQLSVRYYDGKTDLADADRVTLAAGDERTDIDFLLE